MEDSAIMLDKKSYDLLSYLLTLTEPETVTTISKVLNQSRRRVYYHLEKINDALPKEVDKIIPNPRIGIILNDEQHQACQVMMGELDGYSYVMSVEERLELSLIYIAVSKERVTIDKLMKLTDVSRNTILNDLNDIRQKLSTEEYDIRLRVSKARGYYLACHPLSKIQFLYRLLYRVYTKDNETFIAIIRKRIINLPEVSPYFSDEINDYLYTELSTIEERLGKRLNPKDLNFMVNVLPYLLLSYHIIDFTAEEKEKARRDFSLTWERLEYQIAINIAKQLQENFQLSLDSIEVGLIAMLLLSFRKTLDLHLESTDYDDMREILQLFLNTLQTKYQLSFQHPNDLLNQLLTHCKALLYRKTYGVLSENPLTEDVKMKYSQLFNMTKSCIYILEEAWLIQLTDDDIAYFVIHLGGEMANPDITDIQKNHVVLVCDEGVGIQKLLVSQCKKYLEDCEIDAIFTLEQFYSVSDIITSNMIISTSDNVETRLPLLVVHPILTDEDIIRILHFLRTKGGQKESHYDQQLDKLLKSYVSDDNERYGLKTQIEKIMRQEFIDTDVS